MTRRDGPTPEYLRSRLAYDPFDGTLWWKYHSGLPKNWNTKWAGKEAFASIDSTGYRVGRIDDVKYHAHRIIWAMYRGWTDSHIDHEDHNKLNNMLHNLCAKDQADNNRNMPMPSHNTSGVVGVGWHSQTSKWQARIEFEGKAMSLGLFHYFEDAVAARKAAEIQYGFHKNHGMN